MTETKKVELKHNMGSMPILVLKNTVLFPKCSHKFDISGQGVLSVLRKVVKDDRLIFITANNETNLDTPFLKSMGVVASITQMRRYSDGETMQIQVLPIYRAYAMISPDEKYDFPMVMVFKCDEINDVDDETIGICERIFNELIPQINSLESRNSIDVDSFSFNKKSKSKCGELLDNATYLSSFDWHIKQEILECMSHRSRAILLYKALITELSLASLDDEIESQIMDSMENGQREYYLREKINVIKKELGEDENEIEEFRRKIDELKLGESITKSLLKECGKLEKLPFGSPESAVVRGYLDVCLSIPWNNKTEDTLDIEAAADILDEEHYGMEKVKERILELISVRSLVPDIKGQIICLAGPPGVGKTSIAKSIAEALGRKYVRISLGGVRDEAEIRGHRKTYLGSMPGRIINSLIKCEVSNPLILLDEIDKLANDYRGDPTSALLEVLDPEQNKSFVDHFVELPVDLSEVLFITTANNVNAIPAPLYDRMEVIELPSYTHEEKAAIAKKYLVPKQVKNCGLSSKTLKISDTAIAKLIDDYTREAGVRNLEREIGSLCRKCAKRIVAGESEKISVTARNLEGFMGKAKYKREELPKTLEKGMANGLAWTSIGGEMLEIEIAVMEGSGKLELTGNLGSVMQESAKTAMSCVRQRAKELGIAPDYYKTMDVHMHFPEGAVPKDGPSAGITIATALVSALTGNAVKGDVAMTGEITIGGRVLAIGGLREKSMAALRHGIKTVIIPAANEADISEFSDTVKENIRFIPVTKIDEVFAAAFNQPFVRAEQNDKENLNNEV